MHSCNTNESRSDSPRPIRLVRNAPMATLGSGNPDHDRFIRRPEVQNITSLSRSSLYRLIALGEFPAPIRLSANSVAWLSSEVHQWVNSRVALTRNSLLPRTTRTGG